MMLYICIPTKAHVQIHPKETILTWILHLKSIRYKFTKFVHTKDTRELQGKSHESEEREREQVWMDLLLGCFVLEISLVLSRGVRLGPSSRICTCKFRQPNEYVKWGHRQSRVYRIKWRGSCRQHKIITIYCIRNQYKHSIDDNQLSGYYY